MKFVSLILMPLCFLTACTTVQDQSINTSNKTVTKQSDYIDFNFFAIRNDEGLTKSYIYRSESRYTNGNLVYKETPVLGEVIAKPTHKNNDIILAPHFFAQHHAFDYDPATVQINGKQLTHSVQGNNKRLVSTMTFATKDISGITAKDTDKASTILSLFNITTAKFPQGSRCDYPIKAHDSFAYYRFNLEDDKIDQGLDDIIKQQSKKYKVNVIQVGDNNEYRLAYYQTEENSPLVWLDKNIEAFVEYKGQVYTPLFYKMHNHSFDTVSCDSYNEIALNYLQHQIKDNVNLEDF